MPKAWKGGYLYSLTCREVVFSETEISIPGYVLGLGNPHAASAPVTFSGESVAS